MSPKSRRPDPDAPAAGVSAMEIAEAEAAIAAGLPDTGPGALRRVLGSEAGFATIVELVPVGRRAGRRAGPEAAAHGRGPRGQPADHRALGHRQRRRPRPPLARRPRRGAARAGPRRHRPRRLPRPEPQRHAEPGLGPPVARPDERPRDHRRLPGRGLRGPAQARVRHRLGGAARAAPRAGHARRRQGRHRRAARIPSSTASTWAARSTPSSASSATSCRSSSSSPSSAAAAPTTRSPRSATTPTARTCCCAGCAARASTMPVVGNAYILVGAGRPGVQRQQGPGLRGHRRPARGRGARGGEPRQGPRLLPRVRGQAAGGQPRPGLPGHLHLAGTATRRRWPGSSSSPTPTPRTTGARS